MVTLLHRCSCTGGEDLLGNFRAPGVGDTSAYSGRGGRFRGRAGRRIYGGHSGGAASGRAQTTAGGRPLAVLGPVPPPVPLNRDHEIVHGDSLR